MKHASDNNSTAQQTQPTCIRENTTEIKEMEKRLLNLINQQGQDIATDFSQFQQEIIKQYRSNRGNQDVGEQLAKRFSYEMAQMELKLTGMIKQLEKRPARLLSSDEKSIKASELRLESKINSAIERVNEVSNKIVLSLQALKKQDLRILSLYSHPIKRQTRLQSS